MLLNQYPMANHGNYMSNHLYISSIIYIFENHFLIIFYHFLPSCWLQDDKKKYSYGQSKPSHISLKIIQSSMP
jgi:hypothetical protein